MKLSLYTNFLKTVTYSVFQNLIIVYFLIFSSNLFAQEENQTVKEKMTCQKIELIINGQKYDDGHKCVSSEAICYLVEGLSLSCFAKPNTEQISDKPKTN